VRAAEEAVASHKYSSQLNLADVPFLNMKDVKKGDERFHYNPAFLQNVTMNDSGVHIPLEIYEGCEYKFADQLSRKKYIIELENIYMNNRERTNRNGTRPTKDEQNL